MVPTPPAGPTVGACANADGSARIDPITAAARTAEAMRRVNIDIVFSSFLRPRDSGTFDDCALNVPPN